jgi:chorismate mutase/prephenate dehydrogenase
MTEILKPLRTKIDSIDEQIVTLLVEREKIVHQVADIKEEHGIAVVLPERIAKVVDQAGQRAKALGGTESYARQIYKRIIELSCELETDLIDKG